MTGRTQRLSLLASPSLVSSHPIGLRGVVFEQHLVRAGEMAAAPRPHTQLDLHLGPPQAIECRTAADAPWLPAAASVGSLTVTPANASYNVRWEGQRELLIFALDLETCRQYLPELLPPAGFTTRAVTNGDDPQLWHLARAFQAEADAGCPTGRIYADSLAAAFVASFIDRYVVRATSPEVGALSPARLHLLTQYIQEHLDGELSIAALAALARTSPFHFSRQFKRSTGLTPHQFVVERRLDKAQRLLESDALSIAEVAYATGFPSQAHFTSVFRRKLGQTPKAWRSEHSKN